MCNAIIARDVYCAVLSGVKIFCAAKIQYRSTAQRKIIQDFSSHPKYLEMFTAQPNFPIGLLRRRKLCRSGKCLKITQL